MKEVVKDTLKDIRGAYRVWNFSAMLTLMIVFLQPPTPEQPTPLFQLFIVIFYACLLLSWLGEALASAKRRIALELAYRETMNTPMHEDYK